MLDTILYPTDFSDVSQKAIAYLKGLKATGTIKVILLHVVMRNPSN